MEQRASALQQRLEARRNMFMKAEQNTYGSSRPSGQPSFFFFLIFFFCILGTRALNLTDFLLHQAQFVVTQPSSAKICNFS